MKENSCVKTSETAQFQKEVCVMEKYPQERSDTKGSELKEKRPPSLTPLTSASSSEAFVDISLDFCTDTAQFNQFARLAAL